MFLITTLRQRRIANAALTYYRKLATDTASACKRLNLGAAATKNEDAAGAATHLLSAIPYDPEDTAEQKHPLQPASATTLRNALGYWAIRALKEDRTAGQLSLTTSVTDEQAAAQHMLNVLAEQLTLPIIDIQAFATELSGKDAKDDEEGDEDEDDALAADAKTGTGAASDELWETPEEELAQQEPRKQGRRWNRQHRRPKRGKPGTDEPGTPPDATPDTRPQ
jgi:hypothetical protein